MPRLVFCSLLHAVQSPRFLAQNFPGWCSCTNCSSLAFCFCQPLTVSEEAPVCLATCSTACFRFWPVLSCSHLSHSSFCWADSLLTYLALVSPGAFLGLPPLWRCDRWAGFCTSWLDSAGTSCCTSATACSSAASSCCRVREDNKSLAMQAEQGWSMITEFLALKILDS